MAENSVTQLKEFFGVSGKEMMDFWQALTPEEKAEFKSADLT